MRRKRRTRIDALLHKLGSLRKLWDGSESNSEQDPCGVTPEFLQHHSIERVEIVHFGDGRDIKPHRVLAPRVNNQMLIDRLLKDGHIFPDQHRAAQVFFADWYLSGQSPRVTVNLDGVPGTGRGVYNQSVSQLAAAKRHGKALDALTVEDGNLVMAVVCHQEPVPSEIMKKNGHVRVTRYGPLRRALDLLARHYGIV